LKSNDAGFFEAILQGDLICLGIMGSAKSITNLPVSDRSYRENNRGQAT
jgi:hypothetical protein